MIFNSASLSESCEYGAEIVAALGTTPYWRIGARIRQDILRRKRSDTGSPLTGSSS